MTGTEETLGQVPALAAEAVLQVCEEIPEDAEEVKGYDFNEGINYAKLMNRYKFTGFQGTNLGLAIEQVNSMLNWRLSDEVPVEQDDPDYLDPEVRKNTKCKIFLGYTSNLVSAGTREIIRYLAEHKLVDVIVSSAGGIEEDFIKCLAPTILGDFGLKGRDLRLKGLNRIGNLLVPNSNYVKFEEWLEPILDTMLKEQNEEKGKNEEKVVWSPSKMIRRLGKEINDPSSIYYWCYKNDIPVFCPSLTDGSIGDMIYFHSYKNPGLVLDIAQDIRGINDEALRAKKTGMLIFGGGLVKHHICNANLMRNGADFSVFVNTAQEFDGSDSGAKPDEAISWGKIKINARPVKLYAEATLVMPLIVAETFAKVVEERKKTSETENTTK